jgi:hypothetical protein
MITAGSTICTAISGMDPGLSCSITTNILTVTGILGADYTGAMEFKVTAVRNPLSVAVSPSFGITIVDANGGLIYNHDAATF